LELRHFMDKKGIIIALAVVAALIVAGIAVAFLYKPSKGSTSVEYTVVTPSKMDAWLAVNQTDAYIAWEPYVSSSVVGGTGKVLEWTSEIMPHHPCCVVVASKSFISSTNGLVMTERFVKAHADATIWINDALAHPNSGNYSRLLNISAAFTQRSIAVVKEAFAHVEYSYTMNASFKASLSSFTDMYLNDGAITNDTFHGAGYASSTDFVNDYVNTTYLDELGSVAPSATIINPTNAIRLGYLTGDLHQIAQAVARNATVLGGQSMYEKYGLNVAPALNQGYANGGTEMNAFIEGSVDLGYLGAPPAVLNKINKNANTVIVAQANSEGSGIVVGVHSSIKTLEDLQGHTIATPGETSIQHLLLKTALKNIGLRLVKA
jgi:NitT/TauT family transport system substrate-binding protein